MTAAAIHVIGVSQRCGTNFLARLVALHPDVAVPTRVFEDHFPAAAGDLLAGVRAASEHYVTQGLDRPAVEARMAEGLGRGLLAWLAEDAGIDGAAPAPRLLTKTPGASHLGDVLRLFPTSHLLLLVRDGRDVVASGMHGLGWSFEDGVRRWVAGAQAILEVTGRPQPVGARVRVVRYEDLVADLAGTLLPLLAWLELDPDRLDLDAARSLPVFGSSYARGGAPTVHWDPVPRPDGFEPRGRAAAWPAALRARFAVRAGVEMQALGYPVEDLSPDERARALAVEGAGRLVRLLRSALGG